MTKDIEYKHFQALSDILLHSIKRKDYTIIETLSRFFHEAFKNVRDDSNDKAVIYPTAYYEVVYRIIEELASEPNLSNPPIEYRTAGSVWLLGEGTNTEPSNETYNWIWRNILMSVRYEKDEFIMYHWQTSHQYLTFSLRYIQPEYDFKSNRLNAKNQEQIDKRKSSRKKFIEFHYALGGLLLYTERYKLIKRIFNYTTSTPPKYELLPDSMAEIFDTYNEMRDPFDRKYPFIEHVFPFPDLDGLNSGAVIKKWISSYMALLFLRQYSIFPYLIIMKPLEYPQPPKTQGKIRQWIDGLEFFKKLVTQHLANRSLCEATSLNFITEEWCKSNNVAYPIEFIDNFKKKLEEAYEANAKNLPISQEKVNRFIDSTRETIEPVVNAYLPISNKSDLGDQAEKWFLSGQTMIQDKDVLSENPQTDHLNFHSILGFELSQEIKDQVASTFVIKTHKSFVLKPEDIFRAIDAIGIDSHYLIIGFGVNLDHYLQEIKVQSLSSNAYKGAKFMSFETTRITDSVLFILKLSDLPSIKTLPLEASIISKYSLEKISDTLNLYASVVDLSKDPTLRSELKVERSEDELNKSALLTIGILLEVRWKKDVQVIQLIEYSEYRQRGMPNSLTEVKQFVHSK